jgi:hypothetical protein
MIARMDHAAEGTRLTALTDQYGKDHPSATSVLEAIGNVGAVANGFAQAQVHATLALVEAQRTANLIAYLALDEARNGTDYASSQIDALIRQGLGL